MTKKFLMRFNFNFKVLFFVSGIFLSAPVFSQVIHGKLIDSVSLRAIAFAHIVLQDNKHGTTSDIEGNFSLNIPQDYNGLIYISHISYQNRVITLSSFKEESIIKLVLRSTQLMEVTVTGNKAENPAFRIIRQVIAHKKENDPINLKSYQYNSYNKFLVTMSNASQKADSIVQALKNKRDTAKLKKNQKQLITFDSLVQTTHFFLSESVTEKQVINPDKEKEKLLALKVSGFKSPLFTNVATDYQPFSFYKENISLLGVDFVNPINKGTFNRYDFQLSDTIYAGNDTIFVIQYQPKPKSFFSGLKGILSVSTDGFAIKNVIASSYDSLALVHVRIQQNYEKVDGHWFPTQLNTDIDFKQYQFGGRYMMMQQRSFLKEIKINPELQPKNFGDIKVELTLPKANENQLTLDRFRNGNLDFKEKRTYTYTDSVMRKIRWFDKFLEMMATQAVPFGLFEFDISKLMKIDKYESYRLGGGIYTSNKFSKWFRLGGYAGYGFRDEQWKYGGEMKFNFNLDKDFFVRLSYAKDISETGSSRIIGDGQLVGTESFRNWVSSMYDKIESYKAEIGYRIFPDVHASIFVSRNQLNPAYNYNLIFDNESFNHFLISETGLTLRYVRHENYMSLLGKKIFIGQQFPVVTFSFTQAAPLFDAQNFNYTRFDFSVKQLFKHRNGNKTRFFFAAGYLNGLAPFGKLYNGRGASATSILVDDYFQTMKLYEFTVSKYASVFLHHNFGNVLLNKKYSKPELVLYHNMGIGQLENQNAHLDLPIPLQSFSKGYFESGIGFNNLLRGSYVNLVHWGLGGGIFYRYGAYQFAKTENNIVAKLTVGFTF